MVTTDDGGASRSVALVMTGVIMTATIVVP